MATLLEAINILLVARGVTPIIDEDSGHPDVQAAKAILGRYKRAVCSRKWFFNTETGVTLSPTAANEIRVPAGVISIDNDQNYVIMDGRLYSLEDRTTVLTDAVEDLTLIYDRDWADLPIQAFDYICALAKEEFVRHLESKIISSTAAEDVKRTYAVLQVTDFRFKDVAKESGNPLMLKWREKMITR